MLVVTETKEATLASPSPHHALLGLLMLTQQNLTIMRNDVSLYGRRRAVGGLLIVSVEAAKRRRDDVN